MKRVIVRLGNGLGNQLFTYAAAYTFAKKNNAKLYIDNESGFYKRNKYELHNFCLSAPIAEKKDKFLGFFGKLKRKLLIKLPKLNYNKKFLIEKKNKDKLTEFDPDHLNINFNNNLYFEGHYQSDKYYKSEIKNILKELTFKNNIKNQSNDFIEKIKNSNSVSIHLRQNKFLLNENHRNIKKLNADGLNNNINLIKRGIEFFDKKIENPKYFVWSNNFTEIRSLFPSSKFILVDKNLNKDPALDLYLMSLCKHFILSPSTMHYWGAQLSKNENKICLSPLKIINKSGYYSFSNNKDIKADWWY